MEWQSSSENINSKSWFHKVLLEREIEESAFKQPYINHHKPKSLKLALQALDPKEKAAFILLFQQRYPGKQVAEILGLSHEGFTGLFKSIKGKLRQHLDMFKHI